jgi:hypothetical protein
MFKIPTTLLVIWLAIGALAAWQRDYFDEQPKTCAKTSTIVVSILAGPLNYLGVNPKVDDCPGVPQPSE